MNCVLRHRPKLDVYGCEHPMEQKGRSVSALTVGYRRREEQERTIVVAAMLIENA